MPTPTEPAPPVDSPTEAARPAAVDAPPPRADAPAPTPAAPSVERTDGVAPASAPADPPTAPHPAASGAPADLQSQTITIVIQLQPADGDPAGRPVLVSVRAGQSVPLFATPLRYADLGALPGPVTALLQHLQLRSLEQRRKTPVPPTRAAPVIPPVPPADPASTQLTMF